MMMGEIAMCEIVTREIVTGSMGAGDCVSGMGLALDEID